MSKQSSGGALGFGVLIFGVCVVVIVGGITALVVLASGKLDGTAGAASPAGGQVVAATPSSPGDTSTVASSPAGDQGCEPGDDLIVWSKAPGTPPSAQALGSYNSAACKAAGRQATLDMLQQTSPTGAGYCTVAALAKDNPGYEDKYVNGTASDPPRPKKAVFASASC